MRRPRPFVYKKMDMYFLKKFTVILLIYISILCVMLMKVYTYKIFYFVCENFSRKKPKNLRCPSPYGLTGGVGVSSG